MSTLRAELPAASIQGVTVTEETLTVELRDGRVISVPLAWYPRLVHGTNDERAHWRLVGNGEGIHWPDLDEDVSAENLILGRPSGESQSSLKRWLEARPGSDEEEALTRRAAKERTSKSEIIRRALRAYLGVED